MNIELGSWKRRTYRGARRLAGLMVLLHLPVGCGDAVSPGGAPGASNDAGALDRDSMSDDGAGGASNDADAHNREDGGIGAACSAEAGGCGEGLFCLYSSLSGSCGRNGAAGECARPVPGCKDDPVCACDHKIYANQCEAALHGHSLSQAEDCSPPQGMFACGPRFCRHRTEACIRTRNDIIDRPDIFACRPLPPGCTEDGGSPSCQCLGPIEAPYARCEQTADGNLKLSCPWGPEAGNPCN
jgi:hypothetical protein